MPRSRKPLANPSNPPSVTPERGIELLRQRHQKATEFLSNRPLRSDDYSAWENTTRDVLIRCFGSDSENIRAVMNIGKHGGVIGGTEEYYEQRRVEHLQAQMKMLESCIEQLQLEIDEGSALVAQSERPSIGGDVFVVHGRNEGVRETVARFLERLELHVVVLREKPNQGRTIIEKFEDYSDVGFAVVLLTADDRGGPRDASYNAQTPRARQNVLLELGFFLGKIGRKRVCSLYEEGVEVPTDYLGVLFVPFDRDGAWKLTLAREIKAAGLPVNLDNAV